jgi:hypothetical protein
MKKMVETKKASEPVSEKIPEERTVDALAKKNLTILKRSS